MPGSFPETHGGRPLTTRKPPCRNEAATAQWLFSRHDWILHEPKSENPLEQTYGTIGFCFVCSNTYFLKHEENAGHQPRVNATMCCMLSALGSPLSSFLLESQSACLWGQPENQPREGRQDCQQTSVFWVCSLHVFQHRFY